MGSTASTKGSFSRKETRSRVFKHRVKHEILSLEDKKNGDLVDFHIYDEKDVPFLNDKSEMGKVIRKTIIEGDIDDDCQTDEEQLDDAKGMMHQQLL